MRAPRLSIGLGSFLVALALVVAVGVGSAIAVIPNNGTYYACLTKSTGVIKVINYPKVKCAKGQKLLKWSQQGPVGPQGAQGPKGDQGPAGPADWNAIPNIPAGFADGVDNVGTTGFVTETVPCDGIPIAGKGIKFDNLPRNMFHDFQIVQTLPAVAYIYIDYVESFVNQDGTLEALVVIKNIGAATQSCNIRHISFTSGISVANARKQLKKVEVTYVKPRARR